MLSFSLGYLPVASEGYYGDLFIDASLCLQEGPEVCIPRTIITVKKGETVRVPMMNISESDIIFKAGEVYGHVWPCEEDKGIIPVLQAVQRGLPTSITP